MHGSPDHWSGVELVIDDILVRLLEELRVWIIFR